MDTGEREKKKNKKKYLHAFLKYHRRFNPFVASVDGLIGFEAEATLKRLSSHLATKWKELYSCKCSNMKIKVSITLFRAMHHCIRGGGSVPASKISVNHPQWEDGAGLHLFC